MPRLPGAVDACHLWAAATAVPLLSPLHQALGRHTQTQVGQVGSGKDTARGIWAEEAKPLFPLLSSGSGPLLHSSLHCLSYSTERRRSERTLGEVWTEVRQTPLVQVSNDRGFQLGPITLLPMAIPSTQGPQELSEGRKEGGGGGP